VLGIEDYQPFELKLVGRKPLGKKGHELRAMGEAALRQLPAVKTALAEAREQGFTTTLLGRRRYLPDLRSRNRTLRMAAERMATNSVIQGTAADLIKKAMVALDDALASEGFASRMLLQVHDELVFEAVDSEVEDLTALVRERMEGVLQLRVPLVVDVGVGENWREAH